MLGEVLSPWRSANRREWSHAGAGAPDFPTDSKSLISRRVRRHNSWSVPGLRQPMRIAILHNFDFSHLPAGVARNSQDEVLQVAAAVEEALCARGATVQVTPVSLDPGSFASDFLKSRPEVVFNLCESLGGDSRGEIIVPALLDLLGLPYTGSGPLALGLALHKVKAKQLLRSVGVSTPAFDIVRSHADALALELPFPLMVKPAHEDASIGIDRNSVVHDQSELVAACVRILEGLRQPALVEQYVEGREIYCSILGHEALPLTEIDFSGLDADHPRILTYSAKWDESSHEYQATPSIACTLEPELYERVVETARRAFEALELRDYGRVDLRLSNDGVPYVIEVNPNCDLSPHAGFARAARNAGIEYEALVWRLVDAARGRHASPSAHPLRPESAQGAARTNRRVHAGRGGVRGRADRPGARKA